jgi:hypothetical protein
MVGDVPCLCSCTAASVLPVVDSDPLGRDVPLVPHCRSTRVSSHTQRVGTAIGIVVLAYRDHNPGPNLSQAQGLQFNHPHKPRRCRHGVHYPNNLAHSFAQGRHSDGVHRSCLRTNHRGVLSESLRKSPTLSAPVAQIKIAYCTSVPLCHVATFGKENG